MALLSGVCGRNAGESVAQPRAASRIPEGPPSSGPRVGPTGCKGCQNEGVRRSAATAMRPHWLLLSVLMVGCVEDVAAPNRPLERAAVAPSGHPDAGLAGTLVWESNRSGDWRIWRRSLEGSPASRLTPDEPGRRHCCPHLSPDGRWLAYLSLPAGPQEYLPDAGALRLIRTDGTEERELVAAARTYFEHRAVVWRSNDELVYIDDRGRTALLELATGSSRLLTEAELPEYGRLMDAGLRYAVGGMADYFRYREDSRDAVLIRDASGCQPYFSHDGEWAFWTAGVGGPFHRMRLSTLETSTILHKGDRRLPADLGYLYFPMLSRDGMALAFAASDGQHDHFRSDYEVLVVETDPQTLELTGSPVRMTRHPATDRFPDVHLRPLALGRHTVEAPHTLEWRSPDGGADWTWDAGAAEGPVWNVRYDEPGRFEMTASRAESQVHGVVRVRPARAPSAVGARVMQNGRQLEVTFDEPLADSPPAAGLDSGVALTEPRLSEDLTTWIFQTSAPLLEGDRLWIEEAVDLVQRPNRSARESLAVPPPVWPADETAAAFVWQTVLSPNLVAGAPGEPDRASRVEPTGRAVFDRHGAMVLGRGAFVAGDDDADAVLEALRFANRISVEATVTPAGSGRLVAMGGGGVNFALLAEDGVLRFVKRRGARGKDAFHGARIARFEDGETLHVTVTYEPGRLRAYVDGEEVGEWPLEGDFFHWRKHPLRFGGELSGPADPVPKIEGVAIYARILEPEEVRENFRRSAARRQARAEVESWLVDARLRELTPAPSLREISPYREALATSVWEVDRVVSGSELPSTIVVARWAIQDGETAEAPRLGTGRRLRLERFDVQPQLEGAYLESGSGVRGPIYYLLD